MQSDGTARSRVAVVIGVPEGIRLRLEKALAGITVRCLFLHQSGCFRLQLPPRSAVAFMDMAADEATCSEDRYEDLLIISLPYAQIPANVSEHVDTLAELGAAVLRATPGEGWPTRSPRLDQRFQDELLGALVRHVQTAMPEAPDGAEEQQVAFEILRGLASHSKMGPNNHSHEDDLWKSRGQRLGPGGKDRIISELLRCGVLDRKRNDSAGGKGWVYWIADVAAARKRFPDLEPYLR